MGWLADKWEQVRWVVDPGGAALAAGVKVAQDGLAVREERERLEMGAPPSQPGSPAAAVAARSGAWTVDRALGWALVALVVGGGGYAAYRLGLAVAMSTPAYALAAGQVGAAALQRGSGAADLVRAARGL